MKINEKDAGIGPCFKKHYQCNISTFKPKNRKTKLEKILKILPSGKVVYRNCKNGSVTILWFCVR